MKIEDISVNEWNDLRKSVQEKPGLIISFTWTDAAMYLLLSNDIYGFKTYEADLSLPGDSIKRVHYFLKRDSDGLIVDGCSRELHPNFPEQYYGPQAEAPTDLRRVYEQGKIWYVSGFV